MILVEIQFSRHSLNRIPLKEDFEDERIRCIVATRRLSNTSRPFSKVIRFCTPRILSEEVRVLEIYRLQYLRHFLTLAEQPLGESSFFPFLSTRNFEISRCRTETFFFFRYIFLFCLSCTPNIAMMDFRRVLT